MSRSLKNILLNWRGLLVVSLLLFTVSFLMHNYYEKKTSVSREQQLATKYIQTQQKDFNQFLKDSALINSLLSKDETLNEVSKLSNKKYDVFLYQQNVYGDEALKFWSSQSVTPDPDLRTSPDGEYFTKYPNGWYCTYKVTLQQKNTGLGIIAYALIPIQSDYFIETNYLPTHFLFSPTADNRVFISEQSTEYPVKSLSGKAMFWLQKKRSLAIEYNNNTTNLLRLISLLILFLALHLMAEDVSKKMGKFRGIVVLFFCLLILRIIVYLIPSLFNLRQFTLFDPTIYGSNAVQRSLGDLCINAVLVCWLMIYAWSKLKDVFIFDFKFSSFLKWFYAIGVSILILTITFLLSSIVRSLVADSKISFDVTNFFGLSLYTVIGFVLLACLTLSYYFFSKLALRFLKQMFDGTEWVIYLIIAVLGLVFLTIRSGHKEVLFYIPVLIWLLIYCLLINRNGIVIRKIKLQTEGSLLWIFIFSVSIASIMLEENGKAELENRKRMAEKLAVQTDPSSELLMNIAIQYLDNDFLRPNFKRFESESTGKELRDSIIAGNYQGYLNKYDTRLYVYDAKGKDLYNEDRTTFAALNTIINVQAKPTNKDGLYYYETAYDRFSYITKRTATDSSGAILGTLFIVSNLKNYNRDALFPELFKQSKAIDLDNSPIYSTAVYINRQLHSPPGNYPFATILSDEVMPKNEYETRTENGFTELWYRYSQNKVVIVVRKNETMIEAITLFSYLFCSFILLGGLIRFISYLLSNKLRRVQLKYLFSMNIRSQVHSTIIFVSVLSFLIIGAVTISFFIKRYYTNNSDKLSRTMQIMVNEMEKRMAEHSTFDDMVKIYDSVSNNDLQKLVNDVADIHGVDVNVYDLEGNLQVSSEANVYAKGVLSKKMNPIAYYHLNQMHQVLYQQEEKIGNFSYLSFYSPVREMERGGRPYAYVNIPYFTSQPQLQQQISNFLVTIINLNAFIFLVGGLIALYITNRITGSFSIISEKMKEVNLGKMNEQIVWNKKDEIGELVQEYNKMVTKLGASAAELAKSEREGAWREMARQVAHEIKNPLTPMKLSIQYLQKAINNNQDNVKELSATVANTLVEQIDHLSKIAADFSQFANIGNIHNERIDLHQIIASLIKLFKTDSRININWKPVTKAVIIDADKTQMNRLFTNLITNAVQAYEEKGQYLIYIDEQLKNNQITISIKDLGIGIPAEMKEKIFVPNFTTKSSGTGLGLAMCKGIVEQAKGTIWFETESGIGTTFFVSLPIVD